MWKFRYSLTNEKNALTKFLKCVDWSDSREVQNARQLLQQWVPVDVQDLLELLGTSFVSAAPWVRESAVAALQERATDDELLSYLLPLVQAIQYERDSPSSPEESPLAALLIHRAIANQELANFFHWFEPLQLHVAPLLSTPLRLVYLCYCCRRLTAGTCTSSGAIHGTARTMAACMTPFSTGSAPTKPAYLPRCSSSK